MVPIEQSQPTRSGQARWFAEEVQPHEASLRAYLRHSLSSLADVDDLMQECYARLLRERARGVVRSHRAFLFAVARNAVRDLLRRRAVSDAIPITENSALPVLDDGPNVIDFVARREELAILTEAIRALPERCRHVFLLRKIQGLSQKEIAARLGITENTVETLVAKGARRCADHLRAHGLGPGAKS
jgi:RNA polymerase sigma factor (sigma-70 family)